MANDDMTLVREYAAGQSEQAFEALVSRHINLVYSVALRQVRDPHLAEEVTQAVFIILARKAATLSRTTILSGWLCRTARHVAANMLTTQRRRHQREQEAYMQALGDDTEAQAWTQIAPLLDAGLAQLGENDHNAIVLRFLEGRTFSEVGLALGASEDSAKKRVTRAMEKLRTFFRKHGVTLSATVIASAVSAHSVQAAPIGLATSVTLAAGQGTVVAVSTSNLVKSTLNIMAWTKLKTTLVVTAIALLGLGTAAVVIHRHDLFPQPRVLAFAGYATPEAAVQSLIWGAGTGDVEKFIAGLTTEEGERFRSEVIAGKSAEEVRRRALALADALAGYQITRKELVSADEIHVHIGAPPSANGLRGGKSILILKRVGGEWKRDGEID